jgi:hypothetical protein
VAHAKPTFIDVCARVCIAVLWGTVPMRERPRMTAMTPVCEASAHMEQGAAATHLIGRPEAISLLCTQHACNHDTCFYGTGREHMACSGSAHPATYSAHALYTEGWLRSCRIGNVPQSHYYNIVRNIDTIIAFVGRG